MYHSKQIAVFVFSRRLRIQLLHFGPAWTHPHIRNTLIAILIIANRGKNFAFTFIASSHLNVVLRYNFVGGTLAPQGGGNSDLWFSMHPRCINHLFLTLNLVTTLVFINLATIKQKARIG